jgi:hypothetical protein
VEVLDPIDTSKWTAEDMATRVAEVRNLYLRKLGLPEEEVPVPMASKAADAKPAVAPPKRQRRRPSKTAPSKTRMRKTNGSAAAHKPQ